MLARSRKHTKQGTRWRRRGRKRGDVNANRHRSPYKRPVFAFRGTLSDNSFCPTGEGGGVDPTCSPVSAAPKDFSSAVDAFKLSTLKIFGEEFNMAGEKEMPGNRYVSAVLRQAPNGLYSVRLDFGVRDKEPTFVGEKMDKESVALLREVRKAAVGFRAAGFQIEVEASDERRRDAYARALVKIGMKQTVSQQGPTGEIQTWNFAASAMLPSNGHSGVMIALRVPHDVAARIAQPGGEAPEELHVTLAWIKGPFTHAMLGKIETVYEVWRRTTRKSVRVTLDKLATFPPTSNSDGKWVLYATVEGDDLLRVREQLVDRLMDNGVAVSSDFKYAPHVTLKHLDQQPADLSPFQRVTFDAAESVMTRPATVRNVFCPTGEGGGVDPSCSPGSKMVPVVGAGKDELEEGELEELESSFGGDAFVRIQWSGESLSSAFRSEIKDDSGNLESGTSATGSLKKFVLWAESYRWQVPVGDVELVAFEGDYVREGTDGEPVVIPVREVGRLRNQNFSAKDVVGVKSVSDLFDRGWRAVDTKDVVANAVRAAESVMTKPELTRNTFCPTGPGGGVDPSCSLMDVEDMISLHDEVKGHRARGDELVSDAVEKSYLNSLGRLVDKVEKHFGKTDQTNWARNELEEAVFEQDTGGLHWTDRADSLLTTLHSMIVAKKNSTANTVAANATRLKPRPNPLRADPTRTSGVRRRWNADIKRRLAALKAAIKRFLVTDDELGLVANAFCPTGPGGGVDPTCSPSSDLSAVKTIGDLRKANGGVGSVFDVDDFHDNVVIAMHNGGNERPLREYARSNPAVFEKLRTASLFSAWKDQGSRGKFSDFLNSDVTLYRGVLPGDSAAGTSWSGRKAVAEAFSRHGSRLGFRGDPVSGGTVAEKIVRVRDVLFYSDEQGEQEYVLREPVANSFCPTGPGGGVDPTCSPNNKTLPSGGHVKTGADLGQLYHGGKRKVKEVDTEQLQSRDHGFYGTGFYVAETEGAARTYGGRISKFRLKPDARVLVSELRPEQAHPDLVQAIRDHWRDVVIPKAESRGKGDLAKDELEHVFKSPISWKNAVTDYGSYHNFDVIRHTSSEVVVRNPSVIVANQLSANAQRFRFASTPAKLAAFRKWLARQMKLQGLLFLGEKRESQWWERYIKEVWRQGRGQAYDAVNRSAKVKGAMRDYAKDYAEREPGGKYRTEAGGYKTEKPVEDFYRFGKESFLRDSFERPISVERVKVMASRTFTDLKGFSDDMATRLNRTLTDGLIKGQSPRETARELSDQLDISESRALTIARTETIRALNEGQLDALENLGVTKVGVAVEWSVSGLGETSLGNPSPCEICAPLEKIVIKTEEAHGLIPRHPNSLVGETVVWASDPVAFVEARYTGNLVQVFTASGKSVTTTENHIFLTEFGFVQARFLQKGVNLLDASPGYSALRKVDHDDARVPTIRDVFQSLSSFASIEMRQPTAVDFHGDGRGMHEEVRIVWADGKLWDQLDSKFGCDGLEFTFPTIEFSIDGGVLAAPGAATKFLKRVASAFDRSMGVCRDSLALLLGCLGHPKAGGFCLSPSGDVLLFKSPSDHGSGTTQLLRDCLDAHPFLEHLGDLINWDACSVPMAAVLELHAQFFQPGPDGVEFDSETSCDGVARFSRPKSSQDVPFGKRLSEVSLVPDYNSGFAQAVAEHPPAGASAVRQLVKTDPGFVLLDKVVDVKVTHVTNLPVYDLQTKSSLIIANGVTMSQCMCSYVPANVGEDDEDQIDTQSGIERAIRESLEEEGGESSWPGAEVEIEKERPESVFNESSTWQHSLLQFSEVINSFCPTGEGGGVDPTCSPSGSDVLKSKLEGLREKIAKAAQKVYDEWKQDEEGMDEECGSGGICDLVSQEISGIVAGEVEDAEIHDGGQEGDDHAYPIVKVGDKAYGVDIPPGVYESGGGYSWKKIEGVEISPDDVDIFEVDADEFGATDNSFCPTGEGGGVDPTCSPGGGGAPKSTGQRVLTDGLQMVKKVTEQMSGTDEWKHRSVEGLVLSEGTWDRPQELPEGVKRGKGKECYMNAYKLATEHPGKYTYSEGFALIDDRIPLPIQHAWVVDKDGGVVDNTWEKLGAAYIGVHLSSEFVLSQAFKTGVYGVFGGAHRGESRKLLMRGLPPGAVEKGVTGNYNPDQPRDEGGRWSAIGGGGAGAPSVGAARFVGTPVDPLAEDTQQGYKQSDGTYTPERKALHEALVTEMLSKSTPVDNPVAYLLGGGPGAGKTTLINTGALELPENLTMVAGDEVKTKLPEYQKGLAEKDGMVASFVHEESVDVAASALKQSVATGRNTLLDGTGDSGIEKLRQKVHAMRSSGHRVVAHYVTVPTDVAVARAVVRQRKTGRGLPESVIRENHAGVSVVFPKALAGGLYDEATLWDSNRAGPPVKVLSHKDGKTVVHEPDLYEAFLIKNPDHRSK